ncbi:Inner membrane protein alx [Metalysinibacillus saudimassiliensis]|uniref:Inner membrane protein alx n=1 Tax=Metalysinibacillus saudimassiliensis TaxID=1461583 RepID=A0A078M2H5_9BACL|nr:Inner membrane protein alx [Metalysinibacillus saudimassiliensis]
MIQQILDTYAQFFDWHMWKVVLTDPVSWGLILSLVLIEGLLSADNALVLAVLVRHLPEKQRKKALLYGMIGAYFFRFVFIGLGVYLVKFWFIKALGALYLAWLSISHFIKKEEDDVQEFNKNTLLVRLFGTFWATVITVEIMDVAFSVDSILAAFAVSSEVWVLLMGGMLGILVMRTVATVFVSLIDRIPELENTAFILIGIIAIKMGLSVFHIEISHYLFFAILIIAFAITFVIHFMRKNKTV